MDKASIKDKIQKMLNLASNNPFAEEAKAAFLKAQEFMLKYHMENPETIEDDEVVDAVYELGTRRKTEFVLMISGVCADNFRAKTAHHGQQVHFFGFRPDAEAAREVFSYILKYGDASHDLFFRGRKITMQMDRDWRYGFIYGLHQAFHERAGYELMTQVPDKVKRFYEALNRTKFQHPEPDAGVKNLGREFRDGYQKGLESLDHREIDGKGEEGHAVL